MITRMGVVPQGTSSVPSNPAGSVLKVGAPNWPTGNPAGGGSGGGSGGLTGMPLDAEGRIALQQAAAARNAYMQSLVQQHQQLLGQYGTQLHSYTEQHPIDERSLLDQYAGNGMAFSSGYGVSEGQLGQRYKDALAALLQTRTEGVNQLQSERSTYNKEYGTDLDAIRQAAAERLVANKQTLGLANGTTNPKKLAQLLNGN